MPERFFAETQYNDYVGTAAFDTHGGTDLHALFEKHCSAGKGAYFPVGLELGALTPLTMVGQWRKYFGAPAAFKQ
jgi:hypothetical protein